MIKLRSMTMDMSAVKKSQYPTDELPEIAMVGRSNVGKSSLINSLLNRRNFARTSQNPGKTRTINFYKINEEFYFVDLPGYGYARVSKAEKEKWGPIMEMYLEDRTTLCSIFLLVDVRHDPTNDDKMMYQWIKHFGYDCVVVATKGDKIKRGQYQKHLKNIKTKLMMHPEDRIILTSSSNKNGIEQLWDEIVSIYTGCGYEITQD